MFLIHQYWKTVGPPNSSNFSQSAISYLNGNYPTIYFFASNDKRRDVEHPKSSKVEKLTIKQWFTSICPRQHQNCQSNTRLQKGSKLFRSYRPISIWPSFSKFFNLSRILLMNTTYFLVSNSVPGNAIQPVWQWLNCSKIILPLLRIKNSLLEVSSTCPKHLTLSVSTKFFLKRCSTMAYAELP